MRFLGVTETCDLGSLYLRLIEEGHEVRVSVSEPLAAGTMRGLVPRVQDWKTALPWVRAAGQDGIILFEAVSEGFGAQQDCLRSEGYQVIGGSDFGDRLENDRAYAQQLLGTLGFPTGHVWEFASPKEAVEWIARNPRRLVAKFSGADHEAVSNYVGDFADGRDVAAYLTHCEALVGEDAALILMEFIEGVEVGVGAYFDGTRFLEPACLDWEHKRFFAGDMGELTGEMGTVATYSGTEIFFGATLRKIEPLLRGKRHVGYVNLNTIVNEAGIWPLEFTCRFGYPGYAVLEPLQDIGWGDLFAGMVRGAMERVPTRSGFSTGVVVTTPPFPYSRKVVNETVGLPILFKKALTGEDRANIHLGEVERANESLLTAGLYGWTAVVTGTGESVAASRRDVYRRLEKLSIPRARYRPDIGERTEEQIDRLRALGHLTTVNTPDH